MITRFDDPRHWKTAFGEVVNISSMETAHLMNTVKMLIQKPNRVQVMLVVDIESPRNESSVWVPDNKNNVKQSIENVTSMTEEQLTKYVMETQLFKAMLTELAERGANIENLIEMYMANEAFKQ